MLDFLLLQNLPVVQGSDSGVGNHLAVGTPPLSPRRIRSVLSRMSSSPAAASATATLVTSLLDNLTTLQHQQQHHHHHHHQQHPHKRLERTQSAPAPQVGSAAAATAASVAAAVNTSRYKTELCRPYEEFGVCKYGDKCQFAHGMAELRSLARHPKYKTELCRTFHTVGFCPYGPRCHFVHNEEEARQHNRAVAAILAGRSPNNVSIAPPAVNIANRPRPSALSPALSLDSPSPPSSLSQSPTNSLGSFFNSEPELHSPVLQDNSTTVSITNSNHSNHCSPPSPSSENGEFRLPVFNRLSASVFGLGDLTCFLEEH